MASRSLALLMVFCVLFIHVASDIASGHAFVHVHAAPARKMMMVKSALHGSSDEDRKANQKKQKVGFNEELRTVPSGPDPLHHNGNTPKKPRTIP